jgi:hypothetical protein
MKGGRAFAGLVLTTGLAAALGTGGAALAKGGGGGAGGTTVETTGVVAFGDGTQNPTRGTWAMSPDGSNLHKLSSQIYPMDVSRNRARVTVLLNATPGLGLCAMRADGTTSPVELIPSTTHVLDARFSLDGAHVLYRAMDASTTPATSRVTLADVVADGNGDVTGLANASVFYSTQSFVQGMDLSRDGTMIVASMTGGLWTVRISDGATQQLTSTSATDKYPRWSPVDDRVVFTRYANSGIAVADLMTVDAGTHVVRTVVSGNTNFYADQFSAWAPDGVNLLFQANKKNVGTDLYQIPSAASGSPVSVTSGSGIQENVLAWGW